MRPTGAPAGPETFAARIVEWQRSHGRHGLPWQNTRDPYRVWLSEIMLQQTQVATVLGYYERFLQRFADVAALAAAPLDDVFALWSGLGYYSRARNLHRCAQIVVAEHGGRFPSSSAALMRLPGIGRSTAAAIAVFCFGERVAIFDGNVKRVLARLAAFDGDLAEAGAQRELWDRASELLPDVGIETYTQGLMDLGATVCLARSPHCLLCPAEPLCVAVRSGEPERFPIKSKRATRGRRENVWLWLRRADKLWLVRRAEQGVWAGLWSLPEFDSASAFDAASAQWPGEGEVLSTIVHTLTHFDWTLHPVRWTVPVRAASARIAEITARWPDGRWVDIDEALALGVPSPVRRLLSGSAGG